MQLIFFSLITYLGGKNHRSFYKSQIQIVSFKEYIYFPYQYNHISGNGETIPSAHLTILSGSI